MTGTSTRATDGRSSIPGEVTMCAARGWRMLLVEPGGKRPLANACPHGVKNATTDLGVIAGWMRRWPDANWAVACGAPGPQVLDVDDPSRVPREVAAVLRGVPRVASARGGQGYFAGTDAGTVNLGYGELRGVGSYQLVPPSTHPSGVPYRWIAELRGPLSPVPVLLERAGNGAGRGVHEPPARLVSHGERHPYLKDFAVRLVRAGVLDERRVAVHLRVEFELACEPLPPPALGYFEQLAEWATRSAIAERERDCQRLAEFIRRRREEPR